MSRIEELIEQYCPEGVEFKELGEAADFIRGITYSKKDEKNVDQDVHKVLRANNITLSTNTVNFNDVKFISNHIKVRENQKLKANDILICAASGSKAHVGKVAYIYNEVDYTFGGFMAVLRTDKTLNSRFLFHLLVGQNFSKYLDTALNSTTINNLNSQIMNGFSVPLPPLPIQQEIVTILDKFTQLEAELETELEARKRQYEYYRNQLLNFEGTEVEWKTLGEVGRVCMCKRVMKHETSPYGDIPFFKIGTFGKMADAYISKVLYDDYRRRFSFPKVGDILISAAGTIGRTVVYNGEPAYFQDSNIVWIDNNENKVTNKFLFYYYKIVEWKTDGGTISRLYNDNLAKTKIPIPPLSEQERIVAILDKFDALVNDISVGLPAEIQARRKQYEYYRGKLLDFKDINHG